MIPFIGPSTIRDSVGFGYDFAILSPYYLIHSRGLRYGYAGLFFVSQRAKILGTEKILYEATLDKYTLQRDAYLQFRDGRIRGAKGEEAADTYVEEGANTKSKKEETNEPASPSHHEKNKPMKKVEVS